MSNLRNKVVISFLEHPKHSYKPILKGIKWTNGNLIENHQFTQLYILPADFMEKVRRETIKTAGPDVSKSLLYYSNQYSADRILSDATELGIEGLDQIRYFFGILSCFGWGSISEFMFDSQTCKGSFNLSNFPSIKVYSETPIHYDIAGITARVIEVVHKKKVIVIEEQCIEHKDKICRYVISPKGPQKPELLVDHNPLQEPKIDPKLLRHLPAMEELINRIQMPVEGVLLIDGDPEKRIVIKDVASINHMIYENIKYLGDKTVGGVLYRCARETNFPFSTICQSAEEIEQMFGHLSLLGWGLFQMKTLQENKLYQVIVRNSPFIVGIPILHEPICYAIGGTLHQIFERYLKSPRIMVREEQCAVKGDPECVFTIKTY